MLIVVLNTITTTLQNLYGEGQVQFKITTVLCIGKNKVNFAGSWCVFYCFLHSSSMISFPSEIIDQALPLRQHFRFYT